MSKAAYRDVNLVTRSFRLLSDGVSRPDKDFNDSDYDLHTSYFSTAMGDNRYLNPLPGYGFNTDPHPKPIMANQLGNMGRWYKRIHHDNAEVVTLTACVPEFSGILNFLTNMFDYSASIAVTKGRAPGWFYYIGQAAGAIAFWPAQLVGTAWNFFEFLTGQPKNQWYYAKPVMGQFMTAAQGIFNDLMVAAGYTLTVLPRHSNDNFDQRPGGAVKGYLSRTQAAKENISYLSGMFPDSMNKDGTIDLTKLALRGVRKYRYFLQQVRDIDKMPLIATPEDKDLEIQRRINTLIKDGNFMSGNVGPAAKKGTYEMLMQEIGSVGLDRGEEEISYPEVASAYTNKEAYANVKQSGAEYANQQAGVSVSDIRQKVAEFSATDSVSGSYSSNPEPSGSSRPPMMTGDNPISEPSQISEDNWLGQVGALLKDQLYGGLDGITFRVEGGNGPASDSFSNSSQQSQIASTFNSTVQAVSDFKFNTGGGVTGIGFVDEIMNTIKEAVAGVAAGSVIGNLPLALLGNSRVIVPEHWQDSTANLHSETINLFFEAPYAHPYSIATNVFMPVAMILPFIVPFSTGGATYGSPFMVKMFQRGKTIIRTGMVRNASITWGEGPLGWTVDRKPRNCRITIDVVDFEPILAVPISRVTNILDLANVAKQSSRYLGDLGKYNDWINRVSGVDFLDTVMRYDDLNRRLTRLRTDANYIMSPSNIANVVSDSIVGDVARIFTGRPLSR